MGLFHSPKIVTDGLVFCLDMANPKCYPGGFGLKSGGMKDLSLNPVGTGNDLFFFTNSGDGPDFVDEGDNSIRSHFHFTASERNRITFENDHGGSHNILTKMGHSGSGTEGLPFTVEFVIRLETIPTGFGANAFSIGGHLSQGFGVQVHDNANNAHGAINIGYRGNSNLKNNDSPVKAGEWYYGAVTRDSGNSSSGVVKWYDKSGLSKTVTNTNITTTWTTSNFLIGDNTSGIGAMDGDIALYRLYKKELSADQISNNFEAIRGRYGL